MSEFDKREWLEDNGVKVGEDWEKFLGKTRVQFCDVQTKDGKVLGPCWPRDRDFVDLSDDEKEIAAEDVAMVRYYEDQMPEESGDGEDGDDGAGQGEEDV